MCSNWVNLIGGIAVWQTAGVIEVGCNGFNGNDGTCCGAVVGLGIVNGGDR